MKLVRLVPAALLPFLACGQSTTANDGGMDGTADASYPPTVGFVCGDRDAGDYACNCPLEQDASATCTDTCTGGDCNYTCAPGSTCNDSCESDCTQTCNYTTTCALDCYGSGGCTESCQGGDCSISCPGGDCTLTCNQAQSCAITDCAGGNCTVNCNGTTPCSCTGGPQCKTNP